MRIVFCILNFYCLALFAQVSAPDLRCLQVKANGDVLLTWIAPADPGNVFNSYDIYYSPSSTGPFSIAGSVNAITTTTYNHTGSAATTSRVYYYIKTKSGPGGTNISAPSDTLHSIFLNLINTGGAPDIKILYNNVHQPPLPSTAGTYNILKEYPANIWSNFATTSALNYADTISVCNTHLNYQVALADNSGCISTSNIQGGVYSDTKPPNQPYVDSISVLPNGNTVIAWHIPRDMDIAKYIIIKNISGINTPIDSVIGRNNTAYTFTTTQANSSAIQLYVYAVDSCAKNPSQFDTQPTTMFLTPVYDHCAHTANLSWNPYVNIPKGILEYRIYSSVNGSPYLRIGATTQTTYTDINIPAGKTVCYFVRAVNIGQTITSSSNRACFFSTQVSAANFVYIKKATIKDKYTAEITVFLDTAKASKGVDLYRSDDGINFNLISSLQFNGTPDYTFTDSKITSSTNSYYYKAIVKDSCGNDRTYSNISKTILLKVQNDEDNIFTKHLNWNDYLGFGGGVSGYNIYRVVNDVQSATPVAYTGPSINKYSDDIEDEAPFGSKIEYLIEAVEGLGNTYGFLESSKSNTVEIYMEGEIFVPTAFAPKGKNRIWLPVTHFVDKSEYSVSVFNRWGSKVFETHDDTKGWDGAGSPNDVYVYLISYKNSRGEYKELKGTFMLFE